MALQGSLRDFSATEILQLVATQKKSGCLTLEWNTERAVIWVQEGRIVSTRQPGMAKDDPLLQFLQVTQRLSDEQVSGIASIQRESNRDLEDLLLNGRYLDAEELAGYIERQILDTLQRLVRWDSGTYRFDPNTKWPHPPLVMLSMEGVVIEAARRVDEQKRFVTRFRDPHQLLGVRDLPDPDEPLTEEERELFGIIDGTHTLAEVVEAAPLSEYETYEALYRLLESHWIEFVGRRDPGKSTAVVTPLPATNARRHAPVLGELAIAFSVVVALLVVRFVADHVQLAHRPLPRTDVFALAQARDLRYAAELYRRDNGHDPATLADLVEDRWVAAAQTRLKGYELVYAPGNATTPCRLTLEPQR